MAEREHRRLAGVGEPPVAHLGAFGVVDRARRPKRGTEVRQLRARRLPEIYWEGDRQPARRIHLPDNDFRDRLRAGLPRIPRLHDGVHRFSPRHGHRVAGLEHHDGVRVGGRNGGDHRVLTPRQRQVGAVEALPFDADREHDREVRPPRREHRLCRADARDRIRSARVAIAFAARLAGVDGSSCRLRNPPVRPGPPIGITSAKPPGGTTALDPQPIGTPMLRVAADDGDPRVRLGIHRQHPAVLQQHDPLPRYLQRNLVVRGHIRHTQRHPTGRFRRRTSNAGSAAPCPTAALWESCRRRRRRASGR